MLPATWCHGVLLYAEWCLITTPCRAVLSSIGAILASCAMLCATEGGTMLGDPYIFHVMCSAKYLKYAVMLEEEG